MGVSTIQIQVEREGNYEPIKAILVGEWLAVHKTPYSNPHTAPDYWTVTHVRTGFAVGQYFESKAQAMRAAELMSGFDGWAGIEKPSDAHGMTALKNRVRDAIRQAQEEVQ